MKNSVYVLDTREKPQYRWTFEDYLKEGECTEIKKVDTGDYTVAGYESFISIDRKKSLDELLGDLFKDKERFKRELDRAKEIENFYLLCEFGYNDILRGSKYSKITPAFFLSVVNEIEMLYKNVRFHFAGSAKNAEYIGYRILSSAIRVKTGGFRWGN